MPTHQTQEKEKSQEPMNHIPCIRCGRLGETRRCHYNGWRAHAYGKGRGIKANDKAVAEFCHNCDELFSEKNYHVWEGGSKSIERSEEFLHWITMTQIRGANA